MANSNPHGKLRRVALIIFIAAWTCKPAVTPSLGSQRGSSKQKRAQHGSALEGVPRVSLGEITDAPGASVRVPLSYTRDPKTPLRSLALQIDYISNDIEFQKAEPDPVAEKAGAEVEVTITKGTPDDKGVVRSQLRITVSLKKQQSENGLPQGLLAKLVFRISSQATIASVILKPSVLSAEDIQALPPRVAKVNAKAGRIVVVPAEIIQQVTCFFFTH